MEYSRKISFRPMEVISLSRKAMTTEQDNYMEIADALIRGLNFRDHLNLVANQEGLPKLHR